MKSLPELLQEIRPEFNFADCDDFIEAGMLDSFDMVTLVSALDRNYGIAIAGTDIVADNFKNLQTISALLARHGIRA